MNSKSLPKRILLQAILPVFLLTFLCFVLGVATIFPRGYGDFPCSIIYDQELKCIRVNSEMDYLDINENARIQVFLDVNQLGLGGGGCDYQSITGNNLSMATGVKKLIFEREGDRLTVNNKVLGSGEKYIYNLLESKSLDDRSY